MDESNTNSNTEATDTVPVAEISGIAPAADAAVVAQPSTSATEPLLAPTGVDVEDGKLVLRTVGMRGAAFTIAPYSGMSEGDSVSLRVSGGDAGVVSTDFDVTENWIGEDITLWVPWPKLKALAGRDITVDYIVRPAAGGAQRVSDTLGVHVEALGKEGLGERRSRWVAGGGNADDGDSDAARRRARREARADRTRWAS
ncbi:hypothetical protein [Pandoraea commovens]|uniref:Uncharacterized protein n=1 Tax=Pandoraea commovens TaxID=2508289 RepID=A0ABY5QEA6_9BURK|nr:hypothetical protein [Pandoraea commovens]UVA78203.1 hypothetical protein NTU39_19295 [Pandoraea commovens]